MLLLTWIYPVWMLFYRRSITDIQIMRNLTCPGRYVREQVFILLQ